ncbi:hypothetical protein Afil01_06630 [Actinorhabdospora filicis]|uniref:Uncharacterized protein n=1 Tax=Actinorhabdospora filicis TaxID=1785913 RepID=A0A9W6SI03_9ACTN|nr:hypothetical protein [Actinorhabdospora filicis]GLZ75856.1 hypothetical protein Afil01_06630 [Actinorhabdospora filicis]
MSSLATPWPRQLRGTYLAIIYGNAWYWWAWAVLILVYVLIAAAIGLWGSIDISLWESSLNSARGTMGAVGVMLTPVIMPLVVAQGVTRRTFALAAILSVVSMAVVSSLLIVLGNAGEALIYRLNDIPQVFQSAHLYSGPGQYHLVFTEALLMQLGYVMGGWAIGTFFYRFGPWLGILLIPVGVLPAVLTEMLVSRGGWFGDGFVLDFSREWPAWAVALTAVGGLAVMFLILRGLLIGTPLRQRKS